MITQAQPLSIPSLSDLKVRFGGPSEDALKKAEESRNEEKAAKLLQSKADVAVFSAKPQPILPKPNFLKRWLHSLSLKMGNGWRWIKRNILGRIWRPVITKADQSIQDLLNEKRPERVTMGSFQRPSRGVAQAKHFLTADDPIVQEHATPKYFNQAADAGHHWNETQIVRDALQNFYDGQGQTLDTTQINVQKKGDQTQIHISASATYDAENLLNNGMTTKKGDKISTGGFGEGAKQMAFMLLRDYGADKVTFRSREWKADFTFKPIGKAQSTSNPDLKGLFVQLSLLPESERIKGNDLTFSVDSKNQKKLIEGFKQGRDLFYHSSNPDFQNPTYENEVGGFKLVPNNQTTHFYYAGQRRPVGSSYHDKGLPGMHLWTHTKMLRDVSRDRPEFSVEDTTTALKAIVEKMSAKQTAEAMQILKEYWFPPTAGILDDIKSGKDLDGAEKNKRILMALLCEHLGTLTEYGTKNMPAGLTIPKGAFISNYNPSFLRMFQNSEQQMKALKKQGHIPLADSFRFLNVQTADKLCGQYGFKKLSELKNKNEESLTLTAQDKRRIEVLKSVLKTLNEEAPTHYEVVKELLSAPKWELVKEKDTPDYKYKEEGSKLFADLPDKPFSQHGLSKAVQVTPQFLRNDNFALILSKLLYSLPIQDRNDRYNGHLTYWSMMNADQKRKWEAEWNKK